MTIQARKSTANTEPIKKKREAESMASDQECLLKKGKR